MQEPLMISVVIVSWNVRDLLQNCINSLKLALQGFSYELIIVDNHSKDETVNWVKENVPEAILIESKKNLGFGPANNLGIQIAKGKYLLLLNPDTIVIKNAIQILVEYLDNHPEAGCVGPKLLNPDGSLQVSSYPFPTVFKEFWRLFHLDKIIPVSQYPVDFWKDGGIQSVDVLQGAALLIPFSIIQRVGYFDEQFFMYTEEVDLCFRIKQSGFKNIWISSSNVIHLGGQSTRQAALQMFLELYASKIRFIRKYHSKFSLLTYKTILFWASLLRVIGSRLVNLFSPDTGRLSLINNYLNLLKSLSGM